VARCVVVSLGSMAHCCCLPQVGVRSVLGTGSTFYFHVTLPIVPAEDLVLSEEEEETPTTVICCKEMMTTTAPRRPSSSSKVSPAPLVMIDEETEVVTTLEPKRRALVVDDVFMNRKLLALSLKREGFECTLAADGQLAVDAFIKDRADFPTQDQFRLICIDAVMPNMNGLEATRKMRQAGYRGLIIGCTGNALAEDIATFIDAGADSVVTKPISLLQLREVIQNNNGLGNNNNNNNNDPAACPA
jgi:CheY-like chemotaxis protein